LLSVIGAIQYGTSKVVSKIVPHFDTEAWRQDSHQVRHIFGTTDKEVMMVVDRRGIHRATKLASTLAHYAGPLQFHLLPAPCGYHLNPIEGFWRGMKAAIGAGRCCSALQPLYWRTRQVLMAHQERPSYEFRW
jgi:hypothetical protein